MATVNNQQEDKNEEGGTEVAGTAGASDAGSPSAGGGGVGGSNVKQDASAQNQSGYTDVGSYLDANQAGAEKMGGQVAENLTNRYNTTKAGAAKSANDLINQVNQGYTQEDAGLVGQVANDPYAAANNPDQLAAFQKQLNDTYTGPSEWGDYGTQLGKVNEATAYGNLNKTPGGTNVLAQDLEGPTASQGVNQLDSLLLQGNQKAASAVQAASDPYKDLSGFLDQQKGAATSAIQTGQTAAQNASQNALNAFTGENGTLTNLNNTINQNTSAAQQAAADQQAEIYSNLNGSGQNGKRYSDATLSALGLTREQGDALSQAISKAHTGTYATGHNFGAQSETADLSDLSGYLSMMDPTTAINAGNVATADQYNQMGAIQKLLGDKTPQGAAINPALASLAGTVPGNLNQFNYDAALGGVNNFNTASTGAAQDMANYLTDQANAEHEALKHKGVFNTVKNIAKNPVKFLTTGADPRRIAENLKLAAQGRTHMGDDPLPDRKEKDKTGVK